MKHSSIFRSRWFALLWAAGIIWFAYDVVGTPDTQGDDPNGTEAVTDATGAEVNQQQLKDLEHAIDSI